MGTQTHPTSKLADKVMHWILSVHVLSATYTCIRHCPECSISHGTSRTRDCLPPPSQTRGARCWLTNGDWPSGTTCMDSGSVQQVLDAQTPLKRTALCHAANAKCSHATPQSGNVSGSSFWKTRAGFAVTRGTTCRLQHRPGKSKRTNFGTVLLQEMRNDCAVEHACLLVYPWRLKHGSMLFLGRCGLFVHA